MAYYLGGLQVSPAPHVAQLRKTATAANFRTSAPAEIDWAVGQAHLLTLPGTGGFADPLFGRIASAADLVSYDSSPGLSAELVLHVARVAGRA
jgi:hypothetical protein